MAFAFWGAGIYGGMQGCPHDVSSSIDMSYYTDSNDQLRNDYRRIGEEIRDTRIKIREAERVVRAQNRRIKTYVRRNCSRTDHNSVQLDIDQIEDVTRIPPSGESEGRACVENEEGSLNSCMCQNTSSEISVEAQNCQSLVRCVKYNYKNGVQLQNGSATAVCKPNKLGVFFNCSGVTSGRTLSACQRGSGEVPSCQAIRRRLRDSFEHQEEVKSLKQDIENLIARRDEIREEQRNLRDQARDDYREQVRDIAEFGGTESGFCLDCTKQREFSWGRDGLGVGLNLLMGTLGGYLGYKGFKDTVRKNVALGYPTPPYSAAQVMFPYVASGIYGAVSSALGGGSLACGASINGSGGLSMLGSLGLNTMLSGGTLGSGAFGYPSGLFGSGGAAAALQLSLGAGLPPGAASLFGSGLPGASLFGSGLPGGAASLLLGSGLPGANLSALLGSGVPGANLFGSGALSLGLGNQLSLFGSGAAGDFSASSKAYTEYYQQQMEYMQKQMAMRQRYMEAQMERRSSIQGLAQEIYKIQEQIQVIASSPIEYGVNVSSGASVNAEVRGSVTTNSPIVTRTR